MEDVKKVRDSRFEILRIICMVLIIMHHFACHGGWTKTSIDTTVNQGVLDFFIIGGKLGVNVFVLISGYFLSQSKFKLKKVLQLIAQILFFSISIYLILLIFGQTTLNWNSLRCAIFPLNYGNWFMPYYLIMYCLSPFINVIINNIDSKKHLYLVLFLTILQIFIPAIFGATFFSNTAWFITLYLIAAYIRLYPNKIFDSFKFNLISFVFLFVLIAVLNIFVGYNAWSTTHLACVCCSITLLLTFKNSKEIKSNIINIISSTTLGIYLLHDNVLFSPILWKKLLCCPSHFSLPWYQFLLFAICCIIIIFISCFIIDILRQLLFNATYKLFKKIKERKQKPVEK